MGKDLTVHLLHGFLGLPSDWQVWKKVLAQRGWQSAAVNLFSFAQSDDVTLASFCDEYVRAYLPDPAVLFGYSMGGRLALEIAKRYPEKVRALVLASTQLKSPQEVAERRLWESRWSERFGRDAWEAVCRDWEAQDVFSATKVLPRVETDFDRAALARALTAWSVTNQEWSKENFPTHPTLWMFGADDLRMQPSEQFLRGISKSAEVFEQPDAGHRFIYELPEQTVNKILSHLSRL